MSCINIHFKQNLQQCIKIKSAVFVAFAILCQGFSPDYALGSKKTQTVLDRKVIRVRGPFIPSCGSDNPKLTVVVYSDCLCPKCYKVLRDLSAIAKKYKKIRIVYKELPVHGRLSLDCSAMALVAHSQGKYWAFKASAEQYFKSMEEKPKAMPNCWTPAVRAGLDIKLAKQTINSAAVVQELKANFDEVMSLIPDPDTPVIVLGDTVIKGALPKDKLDGIIRQKLRLGLVL
ncbi:MAG: thioredoxin domain-containing protein [Holosporales bacterium]|nr:thioredoxin domain-containing protein [Holosporales bacterium]